MARESVLLVCFLMVVDPPSATAQEAAGQISGRVLDAGGHPLPHHRVELGRPGTDGPGRFVTNTDANGQFRYTNLRPGRYRVVLTEGQHVVASEAVELSAGRMEVGGVTVMQPASRARRTSAERLLQGQPMPENFEALSALLAPGGYGYEVIVRDNTGQSMRGRISSMSADGVALTTRTTLPLIRPFAPRDVAERAFSTASVTRVEIVDSVWNGFLIGTAGFVVGLLAVPHVCSTLACSYYSRLAVSSLPAVGMWIDQAINQPIYQRPPQTSRGSLLPLLGHGPKGLVAQVQFQF